jgi:hypothetical protein
VEVAAEGVAVVDEILMPMVRKSHVLIAAIVIVAACGTSTAPGPAYIRGTITSVESNQAGAFPRILVEEDPTKTILQTNTPKSLVTLAGSTRLKDESGKTVGVGSLKVGLVVSVWITGVVLGSYPDQVSATEIRIEKQ